MLLANDRSPKAKGSGGLLAELRQRSHPHHSQAMQMNANALRKGASHQNPHMAASAQTTVTGREAASRAQMSNEGITHFAMR